MRWVSERDLSERGVRLFCLPHAGSGAAGFYRWKRLIGPGVAVCPVQLPGREARLMEPLMTSVSAIVSALHTELRTVLPERPYAIFGHSMSALIAFEWARTIAREGLTPPIWLFASARKAPQVDVSQHQFHRMDDEAMVRGLSAKYGGDAEVVLQDDDLREVFVPILRADLTVVETYHYEPGTLLECPVQAFAGEDDRSVSDEGLARWGELTSAAFESRRFAGDHFFHLGAGQAELLTALSRTLRS